MITNWTKVNESLDQGLEPWASHRCIWPIVVFAILYEKTNKSKLHDHKIGFLKKLKTSLKLNFSNFLNHKICKKMESFTFICPTLAGGGKSRYYSKGGGKKIILSRESWIKNCHPLNPKIYIYMQLFFKKPSNSDALNVMPKEYSFCIIAKSNIAWHDL